MCKDCITVRRFIGFELILSDGLVILAGEVRMNVVNSEILLIKFTNSGSISTILG